MNPTIDLGIISIHWYSIFIFIGILIGSNLAIKEAKKHGFDEDFIINMLFLAIIIGILGARIYYVLLYFQMTWYSCLDWIEVFKINHPFKLLCNFVQITVPEYAYHAGRNIVHYFF